jgi:hypothetical protein
MGAVLAGSPSLRWDVHSQLLGPRNPASAAAPGPTVQGAATLDKAAGARARAAAASMDAAVADGNTVAAVRDGDDDAGASYGPEAGALQPAAHVTGLIALGQLCLDYDPSKRPGIQEVGCCCVELLSCLRNLKMHAFAVKQAAACCVWCMGRPQTPSGALVQCARSLCSVQQQVWADTSATAGASATGCVAGGSIKEWLTE